MKWGSIPGALGLRRKGETRGVDRLVRATLYPGLFESVAREELLLKKKEYTYTAKGRVQPLWVGKREGYISPEKETEKESHICP